MHQISPQEAEIMKIIWGAGDEKLTTRDIEAHLAAIDGKNRNISSLMTVLARLVDKGFLDPVKKFRQSIYYEAIVQEAEYKAYATKLFIDGIHSGKLSSFVSTLLDSGQYTQHDIDEMRNTLNQSRQP